MSKAEREARELIQRIKNGEIQKDTLMNSGVDFDESREKEAFSRYVSYLRTLSYKLQREYDDKVTYCKGDSYGIVL
jgi:hypothetical protein